MTTPTDPKLLALKDRLPPEIWEERVAAANAEAERLAVVIERVQDGESRRAALEAEFPERPHRTMLTRLRRFEAEGRDGLIDRRAPKAPQRKVTEEVRWTLRGLAYARPELGSEALVEELEAATGVRLGGSTVRETLAELGLSRPRGRPAGSTGAGDSDAEEDDGGRVTRHPLAGAELLKAVEDELGAVRGLTRAMGRHLEALPAPEGEVIDDSGHRDERGRFRPSYNTPRPRTHPELGGKFATVERRRATKDLRAMRVANSGFEARYAKDLSLTLLPIIVDTARWSSLQHWQGQHLQPLVGHAYQPATLDKHGRELKLSGAATVAREATASFWMQQEGLAEAGGLVVYIDAATKPVWTHHFTRCVKVSSTGRVMPGTSTVWLNSGSGTPLVYRTFSGQVSVPRQVAAFLKQVEAAAGEGTAERLVVLDRESHAVWLFKELQEAGWQYIVPLRTSVTGPKARFEDKGPWQPYGEDGDQVREGWLWLNDSRKGAKALRHRVVGRRRHPEGRVAWYAVHADELPAATAIDRYFERWPLQEHVVRNGNGRVGLDVQHGYGKKRVTNVAVVNRLEQIEGTLSRLEPQLAEARAEHEALVSERADHQAAEEELREGLVDLAATVDERVAEGSTAEPDFAEVYTTLRRFQRWREEVRDALAHLDARVDEVHERVLALQKRRDKRLAERETRSEQTTIFTVDTELDEIMTAYKLTFMNLALHLMDAHLQDRMELDTLIRSVLTLPGERVLTKSSETIRIYRQERDARAMAAVERACASLNALELTRGPDDEPRRLRFELVDHPDRPSADGGSA